MRKAILLVVVAVHTEAKCLLELPVWLESLKRNDCDSGKLYNINRNLRRGSYKARHVQRSGRTPVRRNAGWDTVVRAEYTAVL